MKNLILLLCIIWNCLAFAGGIGGFDGGSANVGWGSILFQEYSVHVNPLHSRTLCLNKNDQYQALVNMGRQGEGSSLKTWIYQPRVSLKEICIQFTSGNSRGCEKFEYKPYVQPRIRDIEVSTKRDPEVRRVKIPDCQ